MSDYDDFIAAKSVTVAAHPVPHGELASHLFAHQRDLVSWALRRGRAAIFADTGLGKGLMLIEWARHVAKQGRVLILAPLAVAEQIVREAERFGVEIVYARQDVGARIVITNYEMLHVFDPGSFVGVACDESGILKAYDGKTRTQIIEAFKATPWRLACTATPAPNDYTELGNHAEFLGVKSRTEMLAEFFVHDGGETQVWRLKGHAEDAFWRWVCSWGAMVKRPSDLGHDDGGFALPPLRMHEHVIAVDHSTAHKAGMLFADEVRTLADQRATRRATLEERVAAAARIVAEEGPRESWLIWCELNDEADAITEAIPGAVQIAGSDSLDVKVKRLVDFAYGEERILVTKPSIAGHGMNFQIASRMIFAGVSHSYEQTYQAIRRCWRFGQTRPVDVYVIRAETEGAIVANLKRKEADAERLAAEMVGRMRDTLRAEIASVRREWNDYEPTVPMAVPGWLEAS